MKKGIVVCLAAMLLVSCAPALQEEYLERGSSGVDLADLIKSPNAYKGSLIILGGQIIALTDADNASRIEARYIPADAGGRLERGEAGNGRFIAVYPKQKGRLEPERYRPGERFTLAGTFIGLQPGRFDGMEYLYPVFEIQDIQLVADAFIQYEPFPSEDPYLGPSSTLREPFWKDRPGPPGR